MALGIDDEAEASDVVFVGWDEEAAFLGANGTFATEHDHTLDQPFRNSDVIAETTIQSAACSVSKLPWSFLRDSPGARMVPKIAPHASGHESLIVWSP
jgi:hypothetical protein